MISCVGPGAVIWGLSQCGLRLILRGGEGSDGWIVLLVVGTGLSQLVLLWWSLEVLSI